MGYRRNVSFPHSLPCAAAVDLLQMMMAGCEGAQGCILIEDFEQLPEAMMPRIIEAATSQGTAVLISRS